MLVDGSEAEVRAFLDEIASSFAGSITDCDREEVEPGEQLRKSWYMLFFQLPFLPELGLRARRFGMLRRMFQRDPVRPMSNTDVDRYVEALSQPGALTGAINYYRALRYTGPKRIRETLQPIHAPVLVIWGERDDYLGAELAEPSSKWVPNARVVRLPDASHWVSSDAPEAVNRELLAFLG